MQIQDDVFKISIIAIGVICSCLFGFAVWSVQESYDEMKKNSKKNELRYEEFFKKLASLENRTTAIEGSRFTIKDGSILASQLSNEVNIGMKSINESLKSITIDIANIRQQVIEVKGRFENINLELQQIGKKTELYRNIHEDRIVSLESETKETSKMLTKHDASIQELKIQSFNNDFIKPFDEMNSNFAEFLKTLKPLTSQ